MHEHIREGGLLDRDPIREGAHYKGGLLKRELIREGAY